MATDHPIAAFPADVDRDAFGHYLSGFTDGEGCFLLSISQDRRNGRVIPQARFKIQLRDDDAEILQLIQSYWQCGIIYHDPRPGSSSSPASLLRIETIANLATVVVPHFERYPLRAKKARDFCVWREGVFLARKLNEMPFAYDKYRLPKWTPELLDCFRALRRELSEGRQYPDQGKAS